VQIPRAINLVAQFVTKDSFKRLLSSGCQVLHFSGHGNDHCLYFEDETGAANPILFQDIVDAFADQGRLSCTVQLVFIASCASANIGSLISIEYQKCII